jgi:PAS domain S-box-containing protein
MEIPYQQVFEAMPCYLTVQDRDFRILTANRRFQEHFGDYRGRHCYQVYKLRPERCESCPVDRTFRDGQSHRSEEQVTCLNGTDVSVIVYTTPIRDENGNITAVMEMSTDITEIKQLQRQLRDSQTRYHLLFEEAPCYISVQDPELRIVDANRMFRENFGDSFGRQCYEVYKHREDECPSCTVRRTFGDGRLHIHEEVVSSREGNPINVLVHTMPLRELDGRITRVMEMSADITEVRQLESQLTSVGLLISSISHGLKGLLNGLDGGVYLVNSGLQKPDPERLKKGWEIVLRNISRIRSMVLDILYYARDREPQWEPLSASGLLEEVYELVQTKAHELSIELALEKPPQEVNFQGDGRALRTLLMNLLENSLDACRVDSRKDHHQARLAAGLDGDWVCFEVEDNGVGMDRETRDKAFSLFFSSKGGEGTGLGLFISNKIAQTHGGNITISSEEGKGTRFQVRLPLRKPSDKEGANPTPE